VRPVTPLDGTAIAAAGFAAGLVNTVVGSGSLITFPTLLAIGYPPVLANVTNCIGLVPGSASGAVGYRRELAGQWSRILALLPAAVAGGIVGAILLLALPGAVFRDVVPILILLAVILVLAQPRLARWLASRGHHREHPGPPLQVATFGCAIYGGYFGAAMSVVVFGLFGVFLDDGAQRLNALKNVITATVNGAAAVLFMLTTDVAWLAALLLVIFSAVGGQVGAWIGRRLSPKLLRALVAAVGLTVALDLLLS
jgi:uncharacterized membrane protein YfcA